MAHREMSGIVLIGLACIAFGCGTPKLDTANVEAFVESSAAMREPLDGEELERFNDALAYFTFDASQTTDPTLIEPILPRCSHLGGLTADEIVLAAWRDRVTTAEERIAELERRRDRGAVAQKVLDRIEITEAKLYPAEPGFLERPVVEAEVRNRTGKHIYTMRLKAGIRHPDKVDPLVVEVVERPFGSGLDPGQTSTVRCELLDGDWKHAVGKGGAFSCDVVGLEGWRGKPIASTEFAAIDQALLNALQKHLADLKARHPAAGR